MLLGIVVFRSIFAWGGRFLTTFLLGVLLGVDFLGAVRQGCSYVSGIGGKSSRIPNFKDFFLSSNAVKLTDFMCGLNLWFCEFWD